MDFEQWFKERTSGFERLLIRGAITLLIMLLISQALLTMPEMRQALNLVDRLEGEPYVPVDTAISLSGDSVHYLELTLRGEAAGVLEVLINGVSVDSFSKNKSVVIMVSDGDLVEIDGDIPDEALAVVVSAISADVMLPKYGREVHFFGRPETVGRVVISGN